MEVALLNFCRGSFAHDNFPVYWEAELPLVGKLFAGKNSLVYSKKTRIAARKFSGSGRIPNNLNKEIPA